MATLSQSQPFRPANRVLESILSVPEKHVLRWLAAHMPTWVNSDHLTAVGLISMFAAGLCYRAARWTPFALLGVCVCLVLNWFGDSLDGTLARYRNQQRPRYGFYVDHVVDALSALFLLGGLAVSGYMHPWIAIALLLAFNLLAMESYLATYTIGEFHISHFFFGPTELRVLLIVGNLFLIFHPYATIAGHIFRLFDLGGTIAVACLLLTFLVTAARHTIRLYREEAVR